MSKKAARGEKPYKFNKPTLETADASQMIPKSKGAIPKLAVLLGLLSPFYYELYEKCDGKKSVADLSKEMDIELPIMRIYVDKLVKNGLVEL